MAGAYVLRKGDHVRVDVFYFRFSPRGKAILDSATFILFLLFIVVLTWFSMKKAWWSISVLERSAHSTFHAPIYPARIAMALGCLALLFQGVAEFIGNIMTIIGEEIDGRVK
jgi:TRAP-type mannitol/chloroaromatic compound transport system permease small subunit